MYREFKDYLNKGIKSIIFWDVLHGFHVINAKKDSYDIIPLKFKSEGTVKKLRETKLSFYISYDLLYLEDFSRSFRVLKAFYTDKDLNKTVNIHLDDEWEEYTCVDGEWAWRKFEGDIKDVG